METIDLPSSHVSRLNQTSARIQRIKLLLKRRWWVLLLTTSVGIFYQTFQARTAPTLYESVGKLAVGGKVVIDGVKYSEQASNFYRTQEEIIQSPQVRERAETRVETLTPDIKRSDVRVSVYRDASSSIFNVVASGEDPEYTQALLESVLNEYIKYKSEMRSLTSDNTITAITGQIYRLEKQVETAAVELSQFTESNSVVVLEQGSNSAAAYLASLSAKLARYETELDLLQRLDLDQNIDRLSAGNVGASEIESAGIPDDTMTFSIIGPEADYLRAKQQVALLKARKATASKHHKPAHPEMVAFDEEIAELESLINIHRNQSIEKYKQREAAIELQIANLKDEITDWETRALETSSKLNQHERIKAKLANAQQLYNRLSGSLRELDINKNLEQENVFIMQHASAGFKKTPETVQKIAMGAIFGLFAGAGLLFLIDRLDDRINGFAEFQANFSEDVLGQIPQQVEDGDLALIRANDDRHLYSEAFRNLRSSILFKHWHPATPKTILITSAVPAEGKTTIAGNLAVTMALSGARILLIDGDVRRGTLHKILGRSNERGVSEILKQDVSWREAVQRTDHTNLFFIARGSATDHTSERFLSGVAPTFLSDAAKNFDYVIIDSAPVLVADDTTTIAPMVDTVLFVIRMSNTLARLSAKALDLLYDRQVRVGGVILNRASTNLKEYTYYGYANYYTNRSSDADDDDKPKALTA